MIYTIGHEEVYRETQKENNEPLVKTGKMKGYPGGYAFRSQADAQRRINEAYPDKGFVIFGLDCEWNNTYPNDEGWWHHIVESTLLIFPEFLPGEEFALG